jgi:tRNA 2-thiouridine synthesizing protein A
VDARGLRCPLPVIRLAQAARGAPAGTRIVVLATDPAARHDIPAWCRMRNCDLTELTEMTGAGAGENAEGSAPFGTDAAAEAARPETDAAAEAAPSGTDAIAGGAASPANAAGEGAEPEYLRFVVRVRPQPSKAGGSGSGSERSSRPR